VPLHNPSMVQKSFHVESLVAPQHVINGACQFVSQDRQSLTLAVGFFQPRHAGLSLRIVAQEQHRRFGEGPLDLQLENWSKPRARQSDLPLATSTSLMSTCAQPVPFAVVLFIGFPKAAISIKFGA
jgi:hypothetical protein